eukprot:6172165-Pleurochrysis_carterae.AAC.1
MNRADSEDRTLRARLRALYATADQSGRLAHRSPSTLRSLFTAMLSRMQHEAGRERQEERTTSHKPNADSASHYPRLYQFSTPLFPKSLSRRLF